MTKTELMETYTAEQLAEMVEKLQEQTEVLQEIATEKERKTKNNIITVVIGGIVKEYQIEEIGDIVRAYEEIKICQEQNKQCETILPSEYLKVLTLNQTVSELQSEVEKYHKAFENAKNERDYKIAEYQKKIEELENQLSEKEEFEKLIKNQYISTIEMKQKEIDALKDMVIERDNKIETEKLFSDEFSREPIKVTDMLINEFRKGDNYTYLGISELRQIAEHLLVYCNANGEVEE